MSRKTADCSGEVYKEDAQYSRVILVSRDPTLKPGACPINNSALQSLSDEHIEDIVVF